jgi:saccharopine dehydrogenase (NAD+, L-lysine-forming)
MQLRILILGGYGNTGLLIARLLLRESNCQLVIAGRNLKRARDVADELNHEFNTNRVSSKQADASDSNILRTAFEDSNIIVAASSTVDYTYNVANTALEAGADYLDVQLSSQTKLTALNSLAEKIESEGRCFITDGGYHPGVPAAMVRYAATKFDELEKANISAAFQLDWKNLKLSDSTTSEFIDELKDFNPLVLKNKKWIKMRMKEFPKIDIGEPFGKRYCTPMFMEELRSLPTSIPSLQETGFYIAGFNWITDYFIMPAAFGTFKLLGDKAKKPIGKLFSWGLRNFSKPPYGAVLQLEAMGQKDNQNKTIHMKLTHDDAYVLTAVPVVACLLQYLEGSICRPGLWFQANLVEPAKFFDDIKRLGVEIILKKN